MTENSALARYRALLQVANSISNQPSLDALLRHVRRLLSNVLDVDAISILLLDADRGTVRVIAIDMSADVTPICVGLEVQIQDTVVGQAIETQRPMYIDDPRTQLKKIPELAAEASKHTLESCYVLPLSTLRRRLGALVLGTKKETKYNADEVELMTSVSANVATALENVLATDSAEFYERQVAQERDRLRLLLEINNHVISHLDLDSLFRAASESIRKYFENDFTGFWILDRTDGRLHCALLDFPGGKNRIRNIPARELTEDDRQKLRVRRAILKREPEFDQMPSVLREAFRAESIRCLAIVPLSTQNGPLGAITLGSKLSDNFGEENLVILEQVGAQISLAVDNALAYGRVAASRDRLQDEKSYLETEIRSEYQFEDIIGKSAAIRGVLEQVAIVAPTGSTVLLHGETGTGKELIARAIHSLSPRKQRTFVRLNCAAIPSGLVESELFGHERGAFTGALTQKRGRFELADGGTLFLDEIGDISLELQPKLLRAIQEQEFERLGSTKTIEVDVRLIAATHRDLGLMIRNNQFREDLFYRLNVFPIEIPPLRQRREDIPLLVNYFVSRLSRTMQKRVKTVPKEAMDALVNAPWPGNIRELENFIERAVILTRGEELNIPIDELARSSVGVPESGHTTFEEAERQTILDALHASYGKISGKDSAAERLGLKRTTLQNKMARLKIKKADYSSHP